MRQGFKSALGTATAVAAFSLGTGTAPASAAPVATQQETSITATQESAVETAAISCAYGHFCGEDDAGRRLDVYKCGSLVPVALSGLGAYFNNQTPGTRAYLYDSGGYVTGGIPSGSSGYIDWTHVWWVKPC